MTLTADHLQTDVESWVRGLVQARVLDSYRANSTLTEFREEYPNGEMQACVDYFVQRELLSPFQASVATSGSVKDLILGPYLLNRPVSSDELGTTYMSLHRGERRRYAVTKLPVRGEWKVNWANRLVRISTSSSIVPLTEIGSTNEGSVYLAWPWQDGRSLGDWIQEEKPHWGRRLEIVAGLAGALKSLHSADLHHGSVRYENITIGFDGNPRLLNLGMAAILAENFNCESLAEFGIATLFDTLAPEQLTNSVNLSPAIDIYALGCLTQHLLTGRPPFPEGTISDKIACHTTVEPAPLSMQYRGVPVQLDALVQRMLAKKPEARPSAEEVENTLREVVESGIDWSTIRKGASCVISNPVARIRELLDGAVQPQYQPLPEPPKTIQGPIVAKRTEFDHDDGGAGSIDFDVTPPETPVSFQGSKKFPVNIPQDSREIPYLDAPDASDVDTPPVRSSKQLKVPSQFQPNNRASGDIRSSKTINVLPSPINIESNNNLFGPSDSKEFAPPPPPKQGGSVFRKLKFWKAQSDVVQFSVFGPPEIQPGQRVKFVVYAHLHESFANVKTVCRAMMSDVELIGGGYTAAPVNRGDRIDISLALTNAGVAQSQLDLDWVGQTQPKSFDVFVPWECSPGTSSGVISIHVGNDMVGSIPLQFQILPRNS